VWLLAVCLLLSSHRAVIFALGQLSCCMYKRIGHDRSSPEIESQGHGVKVKVMCLVRARVIKY